MSTEDYKHHAVAQGGWHALLQLSQVVTQFSNQYYVCRCLGRAKSWASSTNGSLRTATLLGLDTNRSTSGDAANSNVQTYAERLRDGLIMTHGS